MPKMVLPVDDNPDRRAFIQTVHEDHNFIPLLARNEEESFSLVKDEHPDPVSLGILMPKQSGIKMHRIMKTDEDLKRIPIIRNSNGRSMDAYKSDSCSVPIIPGFPVNVALETWKARAVNQRFQRRSMSQMPANIGA